MQGYRGWGETVLRSSIELIALTRDYISKFLGTIDSQTYSPVNMEANLSTAELAVYQSEKTKKGTPEKEGYFCIPSFIGSNHVPMMVCAGERYTAYVAQKIDSLSDETTVSQYVPRESQGNNILANESYQKSSCRSVEFFGRSALHCDGQKTTVTIVPNFNSYNISGQLMLGRLVIYLAQKAYSWINSPDGKQISSPEEVILAKNVEQELYYFEVILEQLSYLINENKKLSVKYLEEVIYDRFDDLIRMKRKYELDLFISAFELEELRLDIEVLDNDLRSELEMLQEITLQDCPTEGLSESARFVNGGLSLIKYGEVIYVRHPVDPNGDCGYTAFGIDREQAYKFLFRNVYFIRDILKPVISEVLMSNINFINCLVGFEEVKKDFENYLVALDRQDSNLQNYEIELLKHVNNLNLIRAYIVYDVKYKRIDNGWCHPLTLFALAKIRQVHLYFYEIDENGDMIPHKQFPEYRPLSSTETIQLLFVNGNHFERVEPVQGLVEQNISSGNNDQADSEIMNTNPTEVSAVGCVVHTTVSTRTQSRINNTMFSIFSDSPGVDEASVSNNRKNSAIQRGDFSDYSAPESHGRYDPAQSTSINNM